MKLLTDSGDLEKNLIRCIDQYKHLSFATAWASADTDTFRKMHSQRNKIRESVIGMHFYQTHPDVLDAFVDNEDVKFIMQTSGVFHPKMYLFWTRQTWEAFVGSANLTGGGLGKNTEAVLLISNKDRDISNKDRDADNLKADILFAIRRYRLNAECASLDSAASYRQIWNLRAPLLHRLSGRYGRAASKKAPLSSSVMSMSWDSFYKLADRNDEHTLKERCILLEKSREQFNSKSSFCDMDEGPRYMIAGLRTDYYKDCRWFGSMVGSGKFYAAIKRNDPNISLALDAIPLNRRVSKSDYDGYISKFVDAFPDGRHGIATATRLLALKRPDQFVCFDSKNRQKLCNDFGIKSSGMDYQRYWDEIIERITDTVWWNSTAPVGGLERSVWRGRAAMLDAIFYAE
jgi:hypothetical protein